MESRQGSIWRACLYLWNDRFVADRSDYQRSLVAGHCDLSGGTGAALPGAADYVPDRTAGGNSLRGLRTMGNLRARAFSTRARGTTAGALVWLAASVSGVDHGNWIAHWRNNPRDYGHSDYLRSGARCVISSPEQSAQSRACAGRHQMVDDAG